MGDSGLHACVSKKVEKAFENINATSGYVSGWQDQKNIYCIHCSTEIDYFICGLNPIGYFYCSEVLPPQNELLCICKTLESTLKLGVESTLMLFVVKTKYKGDITITINAKLYSTYYDTMQSVETVMTDVPVNLFRVTGQIPIVFEAATDSGALKESIESSIEKLKNIVSSDISAFHLKENNFLLHSSITEDNDALLHNILWENNRTTKVQQNKNKKVPQRKAPLAFELLFQVSGEAALQNNVNHTLVIHCQRRNFQCVSQYLPIDVIVTAHESNPSSDLLKQFVKGITFQLEKMSQCLLKFAKDGEFICPKPYHFCPEIWDFPVTLIYPDEKSDEELVNQRKDFQADLLLPMDWPFLRKSNQCLFESESPSGYLINPHVGLSPSGIQGGKVSLVHGRYAYHHYMQDRINDDGWGCAYRSLQTIFSWFKLQGYIEREVPSHTEIQKALVDVGDKPSSFVGSRQWIGSQEVSFCLDHLIKIKSKILFVSSGEEMANKGRELFNHFRKEGTPIMIGGGVLAHTIIGVDFNQDSGDLKFLILDPHYKGNEDITLIQKKGWCGWKSLQFWDKTAFYNLCLPQRPIQI